MDLVALARVIAQMTPEETPKFQLNEHELRVLAMLDGRREAEQGAWVNACIEYLASCGYIDSYARLTEAGRKVLEDPNQLRLALT